MALNWPDEGYVKFYRRESADVLLWPWQSRAIWPWLIKVADGTGIVETGRSDPAEAVAMLIHQPREVVGPGIAGLLDDGCLERVERGLLIRNYIEAQEARKTEAQKKRDYRQKQRDIRRAQQREILKAPVPTVSPPCPPSGTLRSSSPILVPVLDPDHDKETLSADADRGPAPPDRQVFDYWRKHMGKGPRTAFDDKRKKAVKARLANGYSVADLCLAIDGCAVTPHNQGQNERGEKYDDLELICRDAAHVDRFIGNAKAPPKPKLRITNGRAAESEKCGADYDPAKETF